MQTSKVSTTEYGVLKSDPPWVEGGGGGLDIMRKAPRNPLKIYYTQAIYPFSQQGSNQIFSSGRW